MKERLIPEEQQSLLRMAREAMEHGVKREKLPLIDRSALTPSLLEPGASFVTLTIAWATARLHRRARSPSAACR
jgi:hypothetical protein